MISVDGLTVEFGGTTLFSDISFQINERDRIALMGKNGAGKSTLLKILAGVRQPTRGKVTAPKDCVVAYLPQHLMTEDGRTVFEEASQAFAHLREMEEEIERMNNELATRTDYESDSYMELIEKVAAMSEKFYAIDMTHLRKTWRKLCSVSVLRVKTSTVLPAISAEDGACVLNWPSCCCRIRMCCCWTSRPIIWTLSLSAGWKNF